MSNPTIDEIQEIERILQLDEERRATVLELPIDTESDDSIAREFANRHPKLRYVEDRDKWYRWTGKRWETDSRGKTYFDIREMLRKATPLPKQGPATLRSAQRVAAIEKLSRCDPKIAAGIEQWDRDDWSLNTQDGVVDLKTGTIRPHNLDECHTKITAAGPSGDCPRWVQFLNEATDGNADLIAFLQRVAGYALTGVIREHALFFCYGTGANGKGVFLNTLTSVLGEYATVASMETFTQSIGDRHPTDLALLQNARLVVAQETEEGRAWAENRIKALTGGDPITARFMRQDFFTFQPKFKLLIAGNHKPKIRNVDDAMRRRLHLIPFTVTIPAEKMDLQLQEKLQGERDGILRWCVEGCLAYLRDGLNPPPVVLEATAEYFSGQDLFSQWIEDNCETGPDFWEPPRLMFSAWKKYAEQHNEAVGTQTTFKERMESAGFRQLRDHARGRYWVGIRVVSEPVEDAPY